jgi:hypothetical protein
VVEFHSPIKFEEPQGLTDGWVSDLVDGLAGFDLAVNDPDAVLEERWEMAAGEVTVFVDGGSEYGPAVLPIPSGVVGPAAEE